MLPAPVHQIFHRFSEGCCRPTKNERGRQLRYSKLVRSDHPSSGNLAGRWPLLFPRCWRLEWAVPAQPPAPAGAAFTVGCFAATGASWNDGLSRVPLTLGPFLFSRGFVHELAPIERHITACSGGATRRSFRISASDTRQMREQGKQRC